MKRSRETLFHNLESDKLQPTSEEMAADLFHIALEFAIFSLHTPNKRMKALNGKKNFSE